MRKVIYLAVGWLAMVAFMGSLFAVLFCAGGFPWWHGFVFAAVFLSGFTGCVSVFTWAMQKAGLQ